jgi:hypothetical protein
MNDPGYISAGHERRLLDCYAALRELAQYCEVPSVRAAARMALADLYPAVEGQLLDYDLYSEQLSGDSTRAAAIGTPTAA